jgi:hypothetical protein
MKIGKKDKTMQVKVTLDEGYVDITNIANWYGLIDKKSYTSTYINKQITSYIKSKGGIDNLDEYDRDFYQYIQESKSQ